MKHSKRYNVAYTMFDRQKRFDLNEAVKLLKSLPASKFNETVELHFNLGVDPRKADQQIRNSLVLPNGTGKEMRVLVFAEGDKAEEAKRAGADYVGVDDLIEKITAGWFDFDVVIATPNLMGRIGKLGRVLGPRGLMPNPKVGTVTMDVTKAVNDAKGGQVTYRVDKKGNMQAAIGKVSFSAEAIKENAEAFIGAINKAKPSTAKGRYITNAAISLTMSPSVILDNMELLEIR